MDKILVYCGLHKGKGLRKILKHNSIDRIIAFEPQPELYQKALNDLSDLNIEIVNAAVGQNPGHMKFYIYSRTGCSSLSMLSDDWIDHWQKFKGQRVEIDQEINVEVVNLKSYLTSRGINSIHYLKTDLQGFDLSVIKTMESFLQEKAIEKITCETERDDLFPSAYPNAPSNKRKDISLYMKSFGYKQIDGPVSNWPSKQGTHRDLSWMI